MTQHKPLSRLLARAPLASAVAAALLLSGCGSTPKPVSYEPEEFDSTTTHTRSYSASEGQTCEAARRALLSQGYMLTASSTDLGRMPSVRTSDSGSRTK